MAYGWYVKSKDYPVTWTDRHYYAHYVDHISVDLSSAGSVTRTYPGYEYSDISVIPLGVRYYIFGLSISQSYNSAGQPTVTISWGSLNSSPTTFYVLCTRMDFRSSYVTNLGGTYGLQLFDKTGNGAAWVPDANPLYFLERYRGGSTWYKPAGHNDIAGWVEVETWTNKPPLCMWKSYYHATGSYSGQQVVPAPPSLNALPSRNPPVKRKYRWVVGCEQGQGFSGVSGTSWNTTTRGVDYYIYVFEAYKPNSTDDNRSHLKTNFGIELRGHGRSLVLGDGAPLAYTDIMSPSTWTYTPGAASPRPGVTNAAYAGRMTSPEYHSDNMSHNYCFSYIPWTIGGYSGGDWHIMVPGISKRNIVGVYSRNEPFILTGTYSNGDEFRTHHLATVSPQWWRTLMSTAGNKVLIANTVFLDQIGAVD